MLTASRNQESRTQPPPGPLLRALEWRAPYEFGITLAAAPWLSVAARGDGHPVLVLPGLTASDLSTVVLRRVLGAQGYDCHGWGLGTNRGPLPGVIDRCVERVEELQGLRGRTVSLIGWSLGGLFAREIAKLAPRAVRQVITLGTPFTGDPKATNAWRLFERVSGQSVDSVRSRMTLHAPPPVPTTSIWSRTDGVVSWLCSVEADGENSENIEVDASHRGMGMNPAVLYAVADRLAQPEGRWRPFRRDGLRQLVYPDPQRHGRA